MDLSKEVLVDMGLNAAGYLAAGGLSLILYSLFSGRKRKAEPGAAGPSTAKQGRSKAASTGDVRRRIEFIKFGERADRDDASAARDITETPAEAMSAGFRRDRIEVMGLARKMIEAGASSEKIMAVLPISQAELALISCQEN